MNPTSDQPARPAGSPATFDDTHVRALIEHSSDVIALMSPQGERLYATPAVERVLGYTPDEFVRQGRFAFVHPDDLERVEAALADVVVTPETVVRTEYRLRHKDGSWRWVESVATNYLHEPRVGAIVVNYRDITERKAMEAALKASRDRVAISERRFRTLVEQSPISIQIFDPQGHTVQVNRAWEELWGVKLEDIPGYNVLQDPQLVEAGIMPYVQRAFSGESTAVPPVRYEPDKTIQGVSTVPFRWVQAVIYPVTDEDGRIHEIVLMHEDISAQKDTEERLHFLVDVSTALASSLEFEVTLANVAHLLVPRFADWCIVDILDDRGDLQQVAVAHADGAKEPLVRELRRRFPPDRDLRHPLWRVLSAGEPEVASELSDDALSGFGNAAPALAALHELGIRSHIVVPLIARGATLGVLSLVRGASSRPYEHDDIPLATDLARRAALAVDNARLYRESLEALRRRDEFLTMVSHELRTPLTSLQLQLQRLERTVQGDTQPVPVHQVVGDRLHVINRHVRRLTRLVNALLDASHGAAAALALDRGPVDLVAVVRDVRETLSVELAASGSELHVVAVAPVVGQWDAYRIEQAVTNLLANAIKYGQGKPITITVEHDEACARLRVADEGMGIMPEHMNRIFDRFADAPLGVPRVSGLGLGLYVVQEIAAAHGGSISVASQVGVGTTFTLELPRAPVHGQHSDVGPGS